MTYESMIGITKLAKNILITQLVLCVKHKFNITYCILF